jgi:hypothetical protein
MLVSDKIGRKTESLESRPPGSTEQKGNEVTTIEIANEVAKLKWGAHIAIGDLWVNVEVVDARTAWGRVDYLITPRSGGGGTWVESSRVREGLVAKN